MKRENIVYYLKEGYSPFIYKNKNSLVYCFPVSSGHVDLTFEFVISESNLEVLKSDEYRFKVLYFLLFFEAQATFGTGHKSPSKFSKEEFEMCKNKALKKSKKDLELYIKEFSNSMNLAEDYFETFSKSVF
jgi:hypothetical protein